MVIALYIVMVTAPAVDRRVDYPAEGCYILSL